jgi:glucose-1-phosphate thymidylyltransferase
MAKQIKPSDRGEYEITDLNRLYLEDGTLAITLLGRGYAWLDTGTHASMLKASNFVEAVQNTQGTFIACLEEIAFKNGWISKQKLEKLAEPLLKNDYGKYLLEIASLED